MQNNWMGRTEKKFDEISKDFGVTPEYTGSIKLCNILREKTANLLKNENNYVLEVGVGNGLLLKNIKRKNISYVGVDLSFNMLKEAIKRSYKYNIRFKPIKGEATNLPFKDESFDATICIDIIHHIPGDYTSDVIDELIRVTKEYGQILLEIKNKLNPYLSYVYKKSQKKGPLIMQPLNPISIKRYIISKGFNVKIYYIGPAKWFASFVLFDVQK